MRLSFSRLALEVDLHNPLSRRDFIPVLADVHLGASVMAGAGLAPGADYRKDLYLLFPPYELSRQARRARRGIGEVARLCYRLNRFAYELLAHDG